MEIKYLIEVKGPAWFYKFDPNENDPIYTYMATEALSFKTGGEAVKYLEERIKPASLVDIEHMVTEHRFY